MERDRDVLQAALVGYELGEELGRGGWGIVYAALHERLRRQVAIKMLPRAFAADPEVRARFEEEAQFAARLSHPHVVSVFDFVDHDGVLAIVMERMQSRNLAERFEVEGELQDTACALIIAVSSALHAAHRLGRVHRDVKPENVLFDSGDVPKLSDFGVAKIIGIGRGLTRHGDLIGTPAYMSPEQARGHEVGPESDVYATAILAYELLSGRLPFPPADTAVAQLYQHVHEVPIPLAATNPEVPEVLDRAVMRGLAKDPADRYESAEAFAVAIAQAATNVFGSGWVRDAGVELRLTGRLVDAFRQSSRSVPARRLPSLTTRAATGGQPRLGTVYDTSHRSRTMAPPSPAGAEVAGFALRGVTPSDERHGESAAPPRPWQDTAAAEPHVAAQPEVAAQPDAVAVGEAAARPEAAAVPDPRATIAPRAAPDGLPAPVPATRRPAEPNGTLPPAAPPPAPQPRPTPAAPGTGPPGTAPPDRPPSAPLGVTLAPFAPSPPRRGHRRAVLATVVALAVAAVVLLAAVAVSGRGSDPPSTAGPSGDVASTATPSGPSSVVGTAAVTPPVDRAGAVISASSLDGFEAACRSLGLQGGTDFCRCARDGLAGNVLAAEIDQATSYFGGRSDALPAGVRSIMEGCTTG